MRLRHELLTVGIMLAFLVSCSSSEDLFTPGPSLEAEWVGDAAAAATETLTDPTGDFEIGGAGAPPYNEPVAYSPIDVTDVGFGVMGDYLYLRLGFDGVIPESPQILAASGEVEEQYVLAQAFNFALDTDNNDATGGTGEGVEGVDLCFTVEVDYGQGFQISASYGLPAGPIQTRGGQLSGELGSGGAGSDFLVVRFDVSGVDSSVLPRGTSVEVGGWAVAESDLYSGLTTDPLSTRLWTVPHRPVGGAGGSQQYTVLQPR
jgi:hypothetical protein